MAALLQPTAPRALGARELLVLGDNVETSVDSRCWGPLPEGNVAGRPLWRVAPLARFGAS